MQTYFSQLHFKHSRFVISREMGETLAFSRYIYDRKNLILIHSSVKLIMFR